MGKRGSRSSSTRERPASLVQEEPRAPTRQLYSVPTANLRDRNLTHKNDVLGYVLTDRGLPLGSSKRRVQRGRGGPTEDVSVQQSQCHRDEHCVHPRYVSGTPLSPRGVRNVRGRPRPVGGVRGPRP